MATRANSGRTYAASGHATITAIAIDGAGNETISAPRTITVNTPANVATITSIESGTATNQTSLTLSGYARFTSTSGTPSVQVRVNSGATIEATLENPGAQLTAWSATVTLASGSNTIEARAGRGGTFGAFSSISVQRDTTNPNVTVTTPAINDVLAQQITLQGTVSDASTIESVAVSFDDSCTWIPATFSGGTWSLAWQPPEDTLHESYTVQVRGIDAAGNEQIISRDVTVDTRAPEGIDPVTFSVEPGSYLDRFETLTMNWNAPYDPYGTPTVQVTIDQNPDTDPTTNATGTSFNAPLNAEGEWYAHIKMIDGAGNSETSHFGPWYVGNTDLSTVCSARGQAITLDGFLDVANNEWTTSEFLDDDERAGQARMLYATWDADHFYIGWQGARWQIDGELIAYLDTQTGGSTSALSGAITLPFAADYAIVIEDEITGTLYEYDGSQWITSSLPWEFAHDSNNGGGTEIRLPFGAQVVSGAVQLLALELSDGAPIALFPTTNALTGPWNAAYIWSDLCATDDPGDGQPTALNATLNTGSVPGTKALVGPGSFIEYGISITNNETNQTLSSAQVNLTGATGLSFESITGITCSPAAACTAGENTWTINLPDIDPAETAQFSVTARLAADLTGIPQISTGIELEQAGSPLATATRTHATDSTAPTIALEDPATLSLQPGLQRIVGSADDGTGIGVAAVQVRPEGGTWQTITGTVLWEAVLNVPQVSTYSIDVRALDAFDNTGTPVRYDFTVDTISPTVSITLPATLRGGLVRLLGTATDPLPLGGAITDVEVQLGLETNEWLPAETPHADCGHHQLSVVVPVGLAAD
ncbi:MAG: hypothetical protein HC893_10825 [Chloroflexaceae bacterium]|nr:hypothetical protein [Chloroflexaceae bacterium]